MEERGLKPLAAEQRSGRGLSSSVQDGGRTAFASTVDLLVLWGDLRSHTSRLCSRTVGIPPAFSACFCDLEAVCASLI